MNIISKLAGAIIGSILSLIGGYIVGSIFGKRINTSVANTYTTAKDGTVRGVRKASVKVSSLRSKVGGVFRRKEKEALEAKQESAQAETPAFEILPQEA